MDQETVRNNFVCF